MDETKNIVYELNLITLLPLLILNDITQIAKKVVLLLFQIVNSKICLQYYNILFFKALFFYNYAVCSSAVYEIISKAKL